MNGLAQLMRQGPAAIAQREQLKDMFGGSAALASPPAQRMKVRGTPTNATVAPAKAQKHVRASASDRESDARGNYLHTTFVASAADLTGPVNDNDHDFATLNGVRSDRYDFNADVAIYQYNKTEGPGEGKPVELAIDGEATSCEIGVEKTGTDAIQITHFKKN